MDRVRETMESTACSINPQKKKKKKNTAKDPAIERNRQLLRLFEKLWSGAMSRLKLFSGRQERRPRKKSPRGLLAYSEKFLFPGTNPRVGLDPQTSQPALDARLNHLNHKPRK